MPNYNLAFKHDIKKSDNYYESCKKEGAFIKIEKVETDLTKKFNSYLHVCFLHVAHELSDFEQNREWVKQVFFKQIVNPDIYVVDWIGKNNVKYRYVKSITNKDVDNRAAFEKFRNICATKGIVLPDPDDRHYIAEIYKTESILKKQGLV